MTSCHSNLAWRTDSLATRATDDPDKQTLQLDLESPKQLCDLVVDALGDLKANDIQALQVGDVTSVADWMVIASGTSNRHVKSLADNVETTAKASGKRPIGVEGADTAEWILVDFGSVIVHVMQPATRAFYDLESLWTLKPQDPSV